jgi:hypothetical protein
MSNVQDQIGKMLGAKLEKDDMGSGYNATIRGKKYWFPSLTHAFDAARHGIGEYEVKPVKDPDLS